jgi:hypothetical protein
MDRASLYDRRNFSQCDSVNWSVLRNKSLFEFRGWKIGIVKIDNGESGVALGKQHDLLEVIRLVRRDSKQAVFFECAMSRI